MPDILNDPRFWGPTATSLGVLVTVFLWWLNQRRSRKEISYQVLANTPFDEAPDELKRGVPLEAEPVCTEKLYMSLVQISNSGCVAIRSGDYAGKITVVFPSRANILCADIFETKPVNLDERSVTVGIRVPLIESVNIRDVVLRPFLMNKGDYLKLRIVSDGTGEPPDVIGHVEGIYEFRKIHTRKSPLGLISPSR
jgi:hypothetical protein